MLEMLMDVIAMLRILAQEPEAEEDSLLWPGWPERPTETKRQEG